MKHQQVVIDYWQMLKTSSLFLLLALSGYVLIKMIQTIFWLPRYLEKNQQRLEELAKAYAVNMKDVSVEDSKDPLEKQPTGTEAASSVEAKKDI